MIALTRITSSTRISKGYRLRGAGLEGVQGGSMFAGTAERIQIDGLDALIQIIERLSDCQALTYGTVTVPGDRHAIVTKSRQVPGQNIARSREFFAFPDGQEGVLLLDYDPPKDGQPLSAPELHDALVAACPALSECEALVIASASSFIYRISDATEMRGARGWHVLVRVANAADIPAIGAAIDARAWLAGFGRVELSQSGGKLLRGLIDNSVWQPERLSFDGGAACGAGLIQRRPAPVHTPGRALSLDDVRVSDDDVDHVQTMQDEARGIPPTPPGGGKSSRRRKPSTATAPVAITQLTPEIAAKVMTALLHIKLEVDYDTHTSVGMGLKNSFGDAGFALWDAWSKPSVHYYRGSQALRAIWVRFQRQGYTVGTVYHLAQQQGWNGKSRKIDLPMPVAALPESQHEVLASTVPIHRARAVTLQDLYARIVKDENPPPFSAIRITVGVGKTTSLKTIFDDIKRAKKAITIVAKDKQQCEAYQAAGAFWRHGREATNEGFTPETPWHCPHAGPDGPVETLAEVEHRLQQMCKGGHCAHGNAAMLETAEATGQEPSEIAVKFFRDRPEMIGSAPCRWFDHLGSGQRHAIRVVTAVGISPADLKTPTGQVDFLVVDEGVEWSHSHMVDLPTVRTYIESLAAAREAITQTDAGAPVEWLIAPERVFRTLAIQMGQHAANTPAGVFTPVSFDLGEIVTGLNAALDDHGSAIWEKPQWARWTDLVRAPLRALSAIKDGLKSDSLSMKDGALHVTYLHSIIENALRGAHPIPVILMDATLDATAAAIAGDHVTEVRADPNVDWFIDPRWFMSAKNDAKSLKKESQRLLTARSAQETETGSAGYIICRKALALFTIAKNRDTSVDELLQLPKPELWAISIAERIGWWGWHDAAHDEWNGMNTLLWGQIPIPDDCRLVQYMDHRAALMQVMPEAARLPLADNTWAAGQDIHTGDHLQTSTARLPAQPGVREWLLERVSAMRIQGAGRARASCQDRRVSVWQVGGYPMTGLADHGIRPQYRRLVDGLSGAECAVIHAAQRMDLITAAAAMLVAEGIAITRPGVRKKIGEFSNSLKNIKSKGFEPVRGRYIYINQLRTGSGALDVNEFNNIGLSDHDYALWRGSPSSQMFAGRFDARDGVAPDIATPLREYETDPIDYDSMPEPDVYPAAEGDEYYDACAYEYDEYEVCAPETVLESEPQPGVSAFQVAVVNRGLVFLGADADGPDGLIKMLGFLHSEALLASNDAHRAEIDDLRVKLENAREAS